MGWWIAAIVVAFLIGVAVGVIIFVFHITRRLAAETQDGYRNMTCEKCGHRWTALCHRKTRRLECPSCRRLQPVEEHRRRLLFFLVATGIAVLIGSLVVSSATDNSLWFIFGYPTGGMLWLYAMMKIKK